MADKQESGSSMDWFKHKACSADDSDLDTAIELFGVDAYYVFFRTIEILSQELKLNSPGNVTAAVAFWKKKYHLPWNRVEVILNHFNSIGRFVVVDAGIIHHLPHLSVFCPKYAEMTNEYIKRRASQLKSNTKARTEESREEENRKDTSSVGRKKKASLGVEYTPAFLAFYAVYPRHQGKREAFESWQILVGQGLDPQVATDAAKAYSKMCLAEKRIQKHIKMPATWLNNNGWEDEYAAPVVRHGGMAI